MKLPSKPKGATLFARANRFMWTKLPNHEIVINVPESDDGTHQRILISLIGRYKNVTFDLTSLTEVELAAFRETILIATDAAKPIVELLDQKARDDELNGDDSDTRLYRGIPTVVVRKGALKQYSEELLQRREDILSRIGTQYGSGGSAPDGSSEVDLPDEEVRSAGDDS